MLTCVHKYYDFVHIYTYITIYLFIYNMLYMQTIQIQLRWNKKFSCVKISYISFKISPPLTVYSHHIVKFALIIIRYL